MRNMSLAIADSSRPMVALAGKCSINLFPYISCRDGVDQYLLDHNHAMLIKTIFLHHA